MYPSFSLSSFNQRLLFTINFGATWIIARPCVAFNRWHYLISLRVTGAHIVTDLQFIIVGIYSTLIFIEFDSKSATQWAVTVMKTEPTKRDSASPRIFYDTTRTNSGTLKCTRSFAYERCLRFPGCILEGRRRTRPPSFFRASRETFSNNYR